MTTDELMGYLVSTGQIDDCFGLKKDPIVKCPECESELYVYDNDLFYCKKCKTIDKIVTKKKVYNKRLTFQEKLEIER